MNFYTHGPLNIRVFTEPMFQENALLVWTSGGADAWAIDPGFPPQPASLVEALARHNLILRQIVLTHCHPDHIAGVAPLKERFADARLVCPRDEQHMLADPVANLSAHMAMPVVAPPADALVAAGDALRLGALEFRVLDVAGHSPGGLAYYCAAAGVVIGGDALFFGSIGRYDFPGSDRSRLLRNITQNLLTLPDKTTLFSGHGPTTTIGHERRHNLTLRQELAAGY